MNAPFYWHIGRHSKFLHRVQKLRKTAQLLTICKKEPALLCGDGWIESVYAVKKPSCVCLLFIQGRWDDGRRLWKTCYLIRPNFHGVQVLLLSKRAVAGINAEIAFWSHHFNGKYKLVELTRKSSNCFCTGLPLPFFFFSLTGMSGSGPEINNHVSLQWLSSEQSQSSNLRPQKEQTSWCQFLYWYVCRNEFNYLKSKQI